MSEVKTSVVKAVTIQGQQWNNREGKPMERAMVAFENGDIGYSDYVKADQCPFAKGDTATYVKGAYALPPGAPAGTVPATKITYVPPTMKPAAAVPPPPPPAPAEEAAEAVGKAAEAVAQVTKPAAKPRVTRQPAKPAAQEAPAQQPAQTHAYADAGDKTVPPSMREPRQPDPQPERPAPRDPEQAARDKFFDAKDKRITRNGAWNTALKAIEIDVIQPETNDFEGVKAVVDAIYNDIVSHA